MNWKAMLLPVGLLPILALSVNPAIAGSASVFKSVSGDTVFPTSVVGCVGDVVKYSTRYQGTTYQGTLRIKSPSDHGCDGGRGRWVVGNFEERNQEGTQRCKGQLTLYLTLDPRGGSSAKWSNIQAVPGYRCSGIGTSPQLPLVYATVAHD